VGDTKIKPQYWKKTKTKTPKNSIRKGKRGAEGNFNVKNSRCEKSR
jgi:hypothetical protein